MGTALLDSLEQRFLTPNRRGLDAFRRLARRHRTPDALAAALRPHVRKALHEPSEARRYLWSSRSAPEEAPQLDVRDGRLRPVGELPDTMETLCLLWSAADAMCAAEEAGRAFARALWVARGLDGDAAPSTVVWMHSSWGASGVARHAPFCIGLDDVLARLPRRMIDPNGFAPAFAWVWGRVARKADWDEARAKGAVPDVDLLGPFADLWRSGCGLAAVNADCIALFVGQPGRVPTRARRGPDPAQRDLLAAVRRAHVAGVQAALKRGADPNGRDPTSGWSVLRLLAGVGVRAGGDARRQRQVLDVLAALLEAGAQPDLWEPDFGLAIHSLLATRALTGRVLTCLEEAGHPLPLDPFGRSLVHDLAANNVSVGLAGLLVLLPAEEYDRPDRLGWTPADHARRNGAEQALEQLVAVGCRPRAVEATRSEVRPAGLPVPPGLVEGWRTEAGRAVLADWLDERGDPRGEVLALHQAGQTAAAIELLGRSVEAWWDALAGVHPDLPALLCGPLPDLTFEHGFLVAATLRMPTAARFVEPMLALLDDPRGAFLSRLDILPYGGAQALAHAVWQAASGTRAPAVRALTLGIDEPPGPLDLSAWSSLESVVVSGSGLAALDLSLPASTLSLRLPFQRDRVLPPLLKRLDAPRLTSLQVEWHRALPVDAVADPSSQWGFLEVLGASVPPTVRSLRLRPVSAAMVMALARAPVLDQLTSLRLDSLFEGGVRCVLADPSPFAHLQRLELSVLGMARADREVLRSALSEVLPRAALKGATYRREGALG